MTKHCLWDSSHTFEANQGEEYRHLCAQCYFNIYKVQYADRYKLFDFIKNIEAIKIEHKINELTNQIIMLKNQLEQLTVEPDTIEIECLLCKEIFHTDKANSWQYVCTSCFTKHLAPLKATYKNKIIEQIIKSFVIEHEAGPYDSKDIFEFAKEHFEPDFDK